MKLTILYFLMLFGCPVALVESNVLSSETFSGKVVGVKDGDTVVVLRDGVAITIRLEHVDCPEKGQPFGNNAKKFASDFCYGKLVRLEHKGKTDRYKRLIAEIYIGKKCLNKELVNNGLAWHFVKYSSNTEYASLEKQARKNKIGLWSHPNPIAPWEWRKK